MSDASHDSPPDDPQREQELVRAAIGGDEPALEELLVSRHETLLRYLDRQMTPAVRAKLAPEDVLQQAYLQVFRSIGSFEPKGPGAFYAWLKTIARRKLIDASRQRGREKIAPKAAQPAGSPAESGYASLMGLLSCGGAGPGGEAMAEELRGAFHVALANLPDNHREVVQLRYLEDFSLEEVAQRLGVTTGAARGLCHRARQSLREEIQRLSRFI